MTATLYKASGEIVEVTPANGKKFSLKELQGFCGGIVQFIRLPKAKMTFVCNDEGALIGLPKNQNAFEVWSKEFPADKFKFNNVDDIFGDVLVSPAKFL